MAGCASATNGAQAGPGNGGDITEVVFGHEEFIAGCMSTAGFEYIATIPAHAMVEQRLAELSQAGEDISQVDPSRMLEEMDLPPDPNDEIVRALSDAEQEVYASQREDCFFSTYEAAWGIDPLELVGQFESGAEEAEARFASDPRVIQAQTTLLECGRNNGYNFATVEDFFSHRQRRSRSVVEEIRATGADDVTVDDPIWNAFLAEMETFDGAVAGCVGPFEQTLAAVGNEIFQPSE